MRIETALAKASLSASTSATRINCSTRSTLKGLQAMTPGFDWKPTWPPSGRGQAGTFNVTEPKFFKALGKHAADQRPGRHQDLPALACGAQPVAGAGVELRQPHFAFFSKTLRGVEQQKPRWKRCVQLVDASWAKRWARNSSAAPSRRS
jgi:putative endopeptidase